MTESTEGAAGQVGVDDSAPSRDVVQMEHAAHTTTQGSNPGQTDAFHQ